VSLDEAANEAYVADGYGNKRVAVLDMETGKVKRFWGAYGNKPDDTNLGNYNPSAPPVQQFRNPVHCAEPSNDGNVYVCDRPERSASRSSPKAGKFVKEAFVAKTTRGDGSVWDIAVLEGSAAEVHVHGGRREREDPRVRSRVVDRAHQLRRRRTPAGQFYAVHSIAVDSKGNLYTTETYRGQRLQKFVYKGLAPVTKQNQGTVWPTRTSTH
jgi:DNA-binding beta-propeller fold protein YncE